MTDRLTIDREHFLSDTFLDDVLDNGFDCGTSFHEPGVVKRDEESVSRMIEELAEELGYDPEGDPAVVRQAIAGWLPLRLSFVEDRLASCERTPEGLLVCRRAMRVDEATMRDIVEGRTWPGEFWSAGGEFESFWAKDEDGPELVLTAHVHPDAVDWRTTVARNMNYVYGDEEVEISLPPGAALTIVSAEWDEVEVPVPHGPVAPRP